MRLALVPALLLLLPLAAADTEQGSGVGMNLGFVAPGTWNVYHFAWPGGTADIALSSAQPPVFFADYNLYLYPPGAFADNTLANNEWAASSTHGGGAAERITAPLSPGTWVVAVAPFQTQGERYTLTTNAGDLAFAATAVGAQSFS